MPVPTGEAPESPAEVADAGEQFGIYDSAVENPEFIIDVTSVNLIDHPTAYEESNLRGGISAIRSGELVENAIIKANGVVLPPLNPDWPTGIFTVNNVPIPGVAPGATITFTATEGGDEARLVLYCPNDVRITQPQEGSFASPGPITVSWAGRTHYCEESSARPAVGVHAYDAASNEFTHEWSGGTAGTYIFPAEEDTSVELRIPTKANGYVAEIRVSGPSPRRPPGSENRCTLVRRVHLRAQ